MKLPPDARELLALEASAVRRLEVAIRATLKAHRTDDALVVYGALRMSVTTAIEGIRADVRAASLAQFVAATQLATEPSGANDAVRAEKAGTAYAKAWLREVEAAAEAARSMSGSTPSAYQGGGGSSGGGGSTDSWDGPPGAAVPALATLHRIAAWDVVHAWNAELRRAAEVHPKYRFRQRWVAILDRHLCVRCRRMNGRLSDANGMFAEGWPPLHGSCRCFISTTIDPRPKRAPRTTTMTLRTLDLGTSDVSTPSGGTSAKKRGVAKGKTKLKGKPLNKAVPSPFKGKRVSVRADLAQGGSLHVRHHMRDDAPVHLEGVTVTLADAADPKPVWIQLAKPGQFKGHPAGPFELNEKVFAEIIANFRATENQLIPIDFEHASESEATAGSVPTDGAPAQGWISDLKIMGGCLYGLVEWGDKAREYIKTKKYRFFSPAIRFNARDRVTGKQIGARMTSGGLTNNPFLDGMKPLAARDAAARFGTTLQTPCGALEEPETLAAMRLAHSASEYMPQVRYVLGCSDLSTAAECADQLERLRQHFEAVGQDPDGSHEGIALGRFVYPLRNLVNATVGTTWDEVFDAVDNLISAATDDVDEDEENDDAHGGNNAIGDGDPAQSFAPTVTGDDEGGGAEMRDTDTTTPHGGASAAAKEATMAEATANEITMKLGAVTAERDASVVKLSATEAKLTDTEAKVADLTLSLKDETAKREAAETELVTLRDEKAARDTKDLTDRVTLAFDTYKDAQKLVEDDKETMLIVLKAKPESFEKKYPKVAPAQQHLLKNLTEKREGAAVIVGEGAAAPTELDPRKAARALASQKGISLGEAQRILLRGAPVQLAPVAR